MLRKHLFTAAPVVSRHGSGEMDVAAIATVWVTSETAEAPIDHVFDQRRGPGVHSFPTRRSSDLKSVV